MRALRMPTWTLALLLVTVSISPATTNYAYVANNSNNTGNTVTYINTSTYATGTIPLAKSGPTGPWGVAVNQAGSIAYVTNYGSNTVSVISTSKNSVTATVSLPTGAGPQGIALAPNGKTAYVADAGLNQVSVINTSRRKVTATVDVGNSPSGLAVMPNGTFVYVANSGSKSVSVISTLTNAVVATISVCAGPSGVAISPDGTTAYVPCSASGADAVDVIRTADNTLINTINIIYNGVSHGAFGSAVSPDGQWLYVASGGSDDVVTVINTAAQTVVNAVPVGIGPQDVAFTEDSAFAYVTNSSSNSVSVINTAPPQAVVQTISPVAGGLGVGVMGTITVSTFAGGYVGDNGKATSATIDSPTQTVQDVAGNYYVADRYQHRIRKITPTGSKVTTFAGTGICGYNGDNISATTAMLCFPTGLAFDTSGNLYVADGGNMRVRKISTSGKITTVAGTGANGYSGDGGPATSAELSNPWTIVFDSTGNLYFSEITNNIVRKVNTSGTISTYAGTPQVAGFSGDGGPATSAEMNEPRGIGFDSSGNLYIADSNNRRVRIVSASGTINTFVGTGKAGCAGDGGPALSAAIGNPRGITVNSGYLYVAAFGCDRVRYVNLSSNIINTLAGSSIGYDGDNNPPLSTRFNRPNATLFDASGNALFADTLNGRVRKLAGTVVTTFAGGYIGDGQNATSAALVSPQGMTFDKSGNLYIADRGGNRVRKVSSGKISTVAGDSINGYTGDGGPATSAELNLPQGVAVDSSGNVFIADTANNFIREVNTSGIITTFCGTPNSCNASFSDLLQMAIDSSNNLYIADDVQCVIWKVTDPGAVVSVAAGMTGQCGYSGDGNPATSAKLNSPAAVAVDSSGNLYITDTANHVLREVDTSGIIHTIAGNGTCNYSGDGGPADEAELCTPQGIAVSGSGSSEILYFSDISYDRIRAISGGIITAFAGSNASFNGEGLWPLYTALDDPVALAVDSSGAVYELDDLDHRVRKIP